MSRDAPIARSREVIRTELNALYARRSFKAEEAGAQVALCWVLSNSDENSVNAEELWRASGLVSILAMRSKPDCLLDPAASRGFSDAVMWLLMEYGYPKPTVLAERGQLGAIRKRSGTVETVKRDGKVDRKSVV